MAFIGIVGHYMSSQYKVETTLLGLRRLWGDHSGENMAEAVLEVIRDYGLTGDKIGWFVLDNATSNDTCVAEILHALGIKDTVERRRLRCLGHIINLAGRHFYSVQILARLRKRWTEPRKRKKHGRFGANEVPSASFTML